MANAPTNEPLNILVTKRLTLRSPLPVDAESVANALANPNVARMLSDTNVPTHSDDTRRLDFIVSNLNVERGLPLFCGATVVSPISANGARRAGTSNQDGRLLELAEAENIDTYREVTESGLGSLQCLG